MTFYSTDSDEHKKNIGQLQDDEDFYSFEEYLEDIGELPSLMELEAIDNISMDEADNPDFDWR